jgi:hypothetical protein
MRREKGWDGRVWLLDLVSHLLLPALVWTGSTGVVVLEIWGKAELDVGSSNLLVTRTKSVGVGRCKGRL